MSEPAGYWRGKRYGRWWAIDPSYEELERHIERTTGKRKALISHAEIVECTQDGNVYRTVYQSDFRGAEFNCEKPQYRCDGRIPWIFIEPCEDMKPTTTDIVIPELPKCEQPM